MDVIVVYGHYLSLLKFQARNRPREHVFLDIQHFQEEISALMLLSELQQRVFENHLCLFDPRPFRLICTRRFSYYGIEDEVGIQMDMEWAARLGHLNALHYQADSLKQEVKQAIEIIEEDHGKDIRVFTVVTLFCLPS